MPQGLILILWRNLKCVVFSPLGLCRTVDKNQTSGERQNWREPKESASVLLQCFVGLSDSVKSPQECVGLLNDFWKTDEGFCEVDWSRGNQRMPHYLNTLKDAALDSGRIHQESLIDWSKPKEIKRPLEPCATIRKLHRTPEGYLKESSNSWKELN